MPTQVRGGSFSVEMLDRIYERQPQDVYCEVDRAAAALLRPGVIPLMSRGEDLELSIRRTCQRRLLGFFAGT